MNWKPYCKVFCKKSLKKYYLEHQTLGRWFICTSVPATKHEYIRDWRISEQCYGFDFMNVSSELISTYCLGSHFALRSSIRKPIFYMWEKFCVVVLHGVTTVVDGVTGAANDLAQYPIWQKFLKNNFLEALQNTVLTKSALPVSCLWSRGPLKDSE